jgi:pyridoxamine 5'-phosphate oxidase
MNKSNLKNIRREYQKGNLDKKHVHLNPFIQFKQWLDEALQYIPDDPTAMILSTVSLNGMPSSRIVLLKDCNEESFTFFTNYESKKATDLLENSKASMLFFWKELERQIRIEGIVEKTDS